MIVSGLNHTLHDNKYSVLDEDNQKKTNEEKILSLLKKYKVNDKIDLDDFGSLIDSKVKSLISNIERMSETDFRINRTLAGRLALPEKAGFKIEKSGVIDNNGKNLVRGLKITPYGLPSSSVTYGNGNTYKFNSFIIKGNSKIFLHKGNFKQYTPE